MRWPHDAPPHHHHRTRRAVGGGGAVNRIEVIGDAVLYFGDCREILPTIGRVDAVVTDPPYGMNALNPGVSYGTRWRLPGAKTAWPAKNGPVWDNEAPPIVLELPNLTTGGCVIWGGQFFALPIARGWLVWNKIIRNFTSSVCELAWTNIDWPVDAFDYSHGALVHEGKLHPTQKPLPLMMWCIQKTTGIVLDPFMGSGTTGVACARLGRRFIGIEIHEPYFEIALRRIEQAQRQKDLFVNAPVPFDPADQRAVDLFAEPVE